MGIVRFALKMSVGVVQCWRRWSRDTAPASPALSMPYTDIFKAKRTMPIVEPLPAACDEGRRFASSYSLFVSLQAARRLHSGYAREERRPRPHSPRSFSICHARKTSHRRNSGQTLIFHSPGVPQQKCTLCLRFCFLPHHLVHVGVPSRTGVPEGSKNEAARARMKRVLVWSRRIDFSP